MVVKRPSPWLFVLTGMPYGVGGSFASTVMPYLTKKAEVEVGAIGWYGARLRSPSPSPTPPTRTCHE